MTWTAPSPMAIDDVLSRLAFNDAGLIPAIAQDAHTHAVLMMAWMNADAVRETLETGRVCYWSRSRNRPWRKGESSGHIQHLHAFRLDCDADTLLLSIDQIGPACHTNRQSCFSWGVDPDGVQELAGPLEDV
ncbi:MAG: phosphoribosyl-AMP cyclohydrolase [Alphaproteobacteria bacterium]